MIGADIKIINPIIATTIPACVSKNFEIRWKSSKCSQFQQKYINGLWEDVNFQGTRSLLFQVFLRMTQTDMIYNPNYLLDITLFPYQIRQILGVRRVYGQALHYLCAVFIWW